MRRWARWSTLALGVVLMGCGPQSDVPPPPTAIVGATVTVGGVGTGTPGAVASATVVSAAPTLPAGTAPVAATQTPLPLPTGSPGANSSPAPTGPTATGSPQVAGTTVPVLG